jgi:hypothetical protein
MDAKTLVETNLFSSTIVRTGIMWGKKTQLFEISPQELLKFGEEDLTSGKEKKNLVNALSNVKRAIDCQLDILLHDYGYYIKSKKEKWNFPDKINFLKNKKIIAPRILEKINRIRNLLEHEFKVPQQEAVEDALDVATLFIGYAERLSSTPEKIKLTVKEACGPFEIEFDKNECKFIITESKTSGKITVVEGDKSFEFLLKIFCDNRDPRF